MWQTEHVFSKNANHALHTHFVQKEIPFWWFCRLLFFYCSRLLCVYARLFALREFSVRTKKLRCASALHTIDAMYVLARTPLAFLLLLLFIWCFLRHSLVALSIRSPVTNRFYSLLYFYISLNGTYFSKSQILLFLVCARRAHSMLR